MTGSDVCEHADPGRLSDGITAVFSSDLARGWRQAVARVGCFLGDLPLREAESPVIDLGLRGLAAPIVRRNDLEFDLWGPITGEGVAVGGVMPIAYLVAGVRSFP
jgi:hypothetical protein